MTAVLALGFALVVFLYADLKFFARGRQPAFREAVVWSIGWFVLSLLAAVVVLVLDDADGAVTYTTVYLIERSLSLDNLFVFLLLFAYFAIPHEKRGGLLFWGIVGALVLRGLAILGGVALIERFEWVIYVLGVTLLYLAYKILRGVAEDHDPEKSLAVRAVRRVVPAATPVTLCLAAIIAADIAFAVDSIPAAFAITRESTLILMGNVFALLGLRALFVLVEGMIARFRYLDETIAVVLALVAVKLLIEDLYKVSPGASLAGVAIAFIVGITASLIVDARDPERAAELRAERSAKLQHQDDFPMHEQHEREARPETTSTPPR